MRRVTGSFNDSSNNEPTKSKMNLEYLTRDLKQNKQKQKKQQSKAERKNKNKKITLLWDYLALFTFFQAIIWLYSEAPTLY